MYCTYVLVQGEENFRRKIQIKTLGLLYIAWLLSKSIMGGDIIGTHYPPGELSCYQLMAVQRGW